MKMDSNLIGGIFGGIFTLLAAIFTAVDIRVRQAATTAEKHRIVHTSLSYAVTVLMVMGVVMFSFADFPQTGLCILVGAALLDTALFIVSAGSVPRIQIVQLILMWCMMVFYVNFYFLQRILDAQSRIIGAIK
jgi:hypothetical protein